MAQPSLRRGWAVFTSRPLSLIACLIVAVVVSVVSFLLLALPAIAGYYYAVRQSRGEECFIDLAAVLATLHQFFVGMRRHFWKAWGLGFVGLLVPLGLLILPVLLEEFAGVRSPYLLLALMIPWLPALFLTGAVVLFAYPHLVTCSEGSALRYALSTARTRPLLTLAVGILLLFPVPGIVFHLLMVFSYPLLVASSLGIVEDEDRQQRGIPLRGQVTLAQLGLGLLLAAIMFGVTFLMAWVWSGVGLFVGLGISLCLALLARSKGLL